MRDRYKITASEGIYFTTSTIVEWLPVFTTQKYFDIIIESLNYCKTHKELKIYAFAILDNHFHLVVSSEELSSALASLRRFTAKEIIIQLKKDNKHWLLNQFAFYKKKHKEKSNYQVWQEGFHPELILNSEMLVQKIEYIHNNPVKRGLVNMPEYWKYSSCKGRQEEQKPVIEMEEFPV